MKKMRVAIPSVGNGGLDGQMLSGTYDLFVVKYK